ncbi:hypothetical protein PENSPDRAFT_547740, partial [Peniophora sp. CONT]
DFVQQALREFMVVSKEEAWLLLLKRYAALEVALEFPSSKNNSHRLSTASRPSAVAYWVKRARPWHMLPPINNVLDYGEDMRRWVSAFMPAWRRTPYGWPLTRIVEGGEGGEWTQARKGGANGFFIAIVACSWW